MKNTIIIVFALIIHSFAKSQDIKVNDINKKASGQQGVTYTCPMHPEINAAKPFNCAKCGMKLIKEKPKAVC